MRATNRKSLADRAKKKELSPGCLRLLCLPFLLVGAAMFYGFVIQPALKRLDARNWARTACVIASSKVESHSGDDSTTYSIEIAYHYFFAGQSYASKHYNFTSVAASSGRKAKQAIVNRYPPGTETFCYVNPSQPGEAVIDRSWHWDMLIFGGFALVFVLVGGGGMIFVGRSTNAQQTSSKPCLKDAAISGLPGELKPKHTPLGKFLGMLAFAVIWNGLMGVIGYLVFLSDHETPLFAKIIVGVLMIVGVFILFGLVSSFLALFNPRIRLTAPTTSVTLGGEFQFTWVVSGRSGMLRKLRVTFEGREEATYRRGTDTSTDTKVFAEIPVFETSEREYLSQGSARVVVPPGLMHTFEARNNKVLWRLRVRGEIPRWPDVDDEYPILVLPQPAQT